MVLGAMTLSLIQVILGTQVRQFVDQQVTFLGYDQMHLILDSPELSFYFHRSFSILVFLSNAALFFRNRKLKLGFRKTNWVMALIAIEIASGFAMYYFDFPFGSQAIHLIVAALLFGVQFYLWMESKSQKSTDR
jgi:cytochrome c oxidase assembly protein subunit 15